MLKKRDQMKPKETEIKKSAQCEWKNMLKMLLEKTCFFGNLSCQVATFFLLFLVTRLPESLRSTLIIIGNVCCAQLK